MPPARDGVGTDVAPQGYVRSRGPRPDAQVIARWFADVSRPRDSVLEEQLAVLRQRPEVVGDERLELVGDLAQRVLGRDDLVDEDPRLDVDGTRLVRGVLGVLERVDGLDQANRPGRTPARRPR